LGAFVVNIGTFCDIVGAAGSQQFDGVAGPDRAALRAVRVTMNRKNKHREAGSGVCFCGSL